MSHRLYIVGLFLIAPFFSAEAMKISKFKKKAFKEVNISQKLHHKIAMSSVFKKKFYNTQSNVIDMAPRNNPLENIHIINQEETHTNFIDIPNDCYNEVKSEKKNSIKNMLIKIKEQSPKELINFLKIKTLKDKVDKDGFFTNRYGQKLYFDKITNKIYFDPKDVKIQTNGPIFGWIGYWGTKALAYGTFAAATTTVTVATGGLAGGAVGGLVASSTLGLSTGATITGSVIAGAGGAKGAALLVTGVVTSSGSVGAVIAGVETAAVGVSTALTLCPFLP